MHPIFLPWCAGTTRHERLVRKHVPDSDPGCALQSTSMPALHRRNVPICRPMADGGMRKCSAVEDFARRGACPPQGSGWGVAESAVPIRCTKPQLRLFIPWCAGGSRHGRLVRKWVVPVESPPNSSFPRSKACPVPRDTGPESRGGVWVANDPQTPPPVSTSIFIPWCAGGSRHGRLVRKWVVPVESPPPSFRDQKHAPDPDTGRESRGGAAGVPVPH